MIAEAMRMRPRPAGASFSAFGEEGRHDMTYIESRLGYSNRFDLDDDRLKINCRQAFGTSSEQTFDLREISPDYARVNVRDPWISRWFLYGPLIGLAAFVLWTLAEGPNILAYPRSMGYLIFGSLGFLLLFGFVHPWRHEVAVFRLKGGPPVFLVRKRGRMSDGYDAFVSAIAESARRDPDPPEPE